MSADGERVQLFLGEQERAQADRTLPHGEVCVRSIRSPDTTSVLISMTSRVRVGACQARMSIEPCSRPTENVTSERVSQPSPLRKEANSPPMPA